MPSEIEIAETIAILAHYGQYYSEGEIYLHHPAAVFAEVSRKYKAVAWLHDVFEDSSFTEGHLLAAGIERKTVEAVKILTRDKQNETYMDYIDRIASSRNLAAITVKLADLKHNLSRTPREELAARYRRAIPILDAAMREMSDGSKEVLAERMRCSLAVRGRMYHQICLPTHKVNTDGTFPYDDSCVLCRIIADIERREAPEGERKCNI